MNEFEAFCKERTPKNLQRTYCHGGPHSIRYNFAMWSWSFKWYGPKGGERRDVFGKRNWMPHEQPRVCPRCGFIFSFIGCDSFHLDSRDCDSTRWLHIKDGVPFEIQVIDSESNVLVSRVGTRCTDTDCHGRDEAR